jgi:hypothetical protein
MTDLDLNIDNYTITDIETFFKLNPKSKYSASDVELREYEIREQLLKSGNINKRMKKQLIDFLEDAKEWLIETKCVSSYKPTTIPKNAKLDTLNVPETITSKISREDEIIERPSTKYIQTYNSEYMPGNINPLNRQTITKCLNIDTRFRSNLYNTTSSDFTLQLPLKLHKVISMQISSIEIPISFYGVSAKYGNNYFNISIEQEDDSTDIITSSLIVVIPDGNYNGQELIQKINDILTNATEPIFSNFVFQLDITDSGSGTGKVTVQQIITNINSGEVEITNLILDFAKDINGFENNMSDIYLKLGWVLGFVYPKYEGKLTYVSESIIEPAPIRYIYLAIDDFNNSVNNNFITAFTESILNPNIIARIPINESYFNIIMANELNMVTEPRKYFGPVDIQRLRIQLFDEFGRVLDMNNANYSFCLSFKLLYNL